MRERYPVLGVEEARARILDAVEPLLPESVGILHSLDRVLAEDVVADMDVPPRDNSAMDGYAVRSEDLRQGRQGPLRLRVIGDLAAGYVMEEPVGPGQAVRIMTGAPVPPGADTVVRFEDTRPAGEWVEILSVPRPGRNVRQAGEDVHQGQTVLQAGAKIRPQEVGMMASVGRTEVQVIRRPRIAILATGDELVDIAEPIGPGQIRDINSYSNAAQVIRWGGEPIMLGIARDRREALASKIEAGLQASADLFITSGGVSAGDFDLVKQVLASEGEMDFWWVNMKPGKPMAFGHIGGVPLLGLPGNPVAAMISLKLFGWPTVRKMLGYTDWSWPSTMAALRSEISRKDARRHYLRVRLFGEEPDLEAELTGDQGSGILMSMVQGDGLAVIPESRTELPAGSRVKVLLLD
jgi:molybdopterin molybdotransferase